MRKKILFISVIICLCNYASIAQKNDTIKFEAKVMVLSKVVKDTIALRWGTDKPLAWELSNNHGYMVKRYTMMRDGKLLKKFEYKMLTNNPLKPLPLEQWEAKVNENEYAAIAAQAIYGETFEVEDKTQDILQMINKAKETENRFSFALFSADQSFEVAQMSGLALIDTDIKKNERYLYKIYSLVPHELMAIDTGYVFLDASELTILNPPIELVADLSGKAAFLSWNTFFDKGVYSGYVVERSDDSCKSFKRINEHAFINTSPDSKTSKDLAFYLDSLPEYSVEYSYRVKGITPFGDEGPVSDTVHIKALEKLPVVPYINAYNIFNNKDAVIKWEFDENFNKEIVGFKIARSKKVDGNYKIMDTETINQQKNKRTSNELISPEKRDFIVKDLWSVNYIILIAIDKNGFEYKSSPVLVQLEDNEPPMSPQNIEGFIDTTGLVTLKWRKNSEEDLLGYRVFSSNSKKSEFIQITNDVVSDTVYTTQIELYTLSKTIYYRIVASDFHGNHSKFSDILELKRPDIVAPAPAFFTSISQSDSCVGLIWKNSASDDVQKLKLFRRSFPNGTNEIVASFQKMDTILLDTSYCDITAQIGLKYEYMLVVEDAAGNKTKSLQNIKGGIIDKGIRDNITNIKAIADRFLKQIVITWEYDQKDIYRYYIYRSYDDTPLRLYKTIAGDQISFTDSNLKLNTRYTYKIRAELNNGASSPMSEPITIKY